MTYRRFLLFSSLAIGLALLAGLLAGLTAASSAAAAVEPLPLLRIDIPDAAARQNLAGAGLPIYAELYDSQTGAAFLLAPASAETQAWLQSQGLNTQLLDLDSRGAAYFLASARTPETLSQAAALGQMLLRDGRQAVLRLDPPQAAALERLPARLRRLILHVLQPAAAIPALAPVKLDPLVQRMIDETSGQTAGVLISNLSGVNSVLIGGSPYTIATRWSRSTTPIEKATQYTHEYFSSLGLPASYFTYTLPSSGPRRNVIAQQTGLTQPATIYLITAHLDSTSNNPSVSAPGADDNASGSVAVMMAAKVLRNYTFGCTLRYVLFTGEEQGLYGAEAYAAYVKSLGENIQGVLNLDMIAYNSDTATYMDLHTRPSNAADLALANIFKDVIGVYRLRLTPEIFQDGVQYSDHAAFWGQGYPAILGIEDDDDFNIYYHTTQDTVGNTDSAYFTQFVKASVASFAHMGCLLEGGLKGSVTNAATAAPVNGASIKASRLAGQYFYAASDPAGAYAQRLPQGSFVITATATGFEPKVFTGINVANNLTTTLNIPLQPCSLAQGLDFTYTPAAAVAGSPVRFTAQAAGGSQPMSYSWLFGDGAGAAGAVVTHTYTLTGTFSARLTANNCAGSTFVNKPVNIGPAPEIALGAAALSANLEAGQAVTHTLTISNLLPGTLSWSISVQPPAGWLSISPASGSLGQGSTQVQARFDAAGLAAGVYTTTLRISSNDPDEPLLVIPVTLNIGCTALGGVDFSFLPAAPQIGQPVQFSAAPLGGTQPVTYTWTFGDGSPPVSAAGLAVITHTYTTTAWPGSFSAALGVANQCSAPAQVQHPVAVQPLRLYLPAVAK